MLTSRRGFVSGLAALVAAPAIVRATSLMPVRSLDPWGIGLKVLPPALAVFDGANFIMLSDGIREAARPVLHEDGYPVRANDFQIGQLIHLMPDGIGNWRILQLPAFELVGEKARPGVRS